MDFIHENNRVVVYEGQKVVAEVTFPELEAGVVEINHTFVDSSLRGQGVAGKLLEEVVKHLNETNQKAVLTCSYAVAFFEKHKEYQGLIK